MRRWTANLEGDNRWDESSTGGLTHSLQLQILQYVMVWGLYYMYIQKA